MYNNKRDISEAMDPVAKIFGRKQICLDSGFEEVRHFLRPDGIPEEERPWLASVWRK